MAWTYETVTPTPIENAIVEKGLLDGVHKAYRLAAVDGYVLHDNISDWVDEFGELKLGYVSGSVSCAASYNFTANPREFYAVPENSVPADQIFGDGDNDHEVM